MSGSDPRDPAASSASPSDLVVALDALTTARPELRGATVDPLGRGLDHAAFRVGDLVLRIGADSNALAREAELLAVVGARCPVAVPTPVATGSGWMAYPLLGGTPLIRRPAAARAAHAVPVATDLGRVLGHLWTTPRAAVDGLVEDDDWPLSAWRDEAAERAAALDAELPADLRSRIARWLRAPLPASAPAAERVFSHNDLGVEHVLVDDGGRLTGILDWSDAAIVDPAKDVGTVLRDLGTAGRDAALHASGHRADDDLLARATVYARCLALEDLAFGLETDQSAYRDAACEALSRLFAESATPPR